MRFGRPLLTTELSGSLNGVVASSARGGVGYFRVRSIPSNPLTYLQMVIRAILSGVAAFWKNGLTDEQRAGWALLAGPTEQPENPYIASNTIVMQAGSPRVDDAPDSRNLAWTVIPTPANFTADSTPSSGVVGHVGLTGAGTTYGANGEKISFYVGNKFQPDSRDFLFGNLAYAGTFTIAGTVVPTVPISQFTHPDLATLTTGQTMNISIIKFKTTGEISSRITARKTTV